MPNPGPIYIAVIDDDESIRRSYSRWLRVSGFAPVEYSSAESFLDDRKQPAFECLLLDIRLPGLSGIELRRRLAGGNDQTPVIFLTAHDEPGVRLEAMTTGCAGYFLKTEPGSLVLDAIRNATADPHGRREPKSKP